MVTDIRDPARYLGGTVVAFPFPTPPRPAPSAAAQLRRICRRYRDQNSIPPEVAKQIRELLEIEREEHTPPAGPDVD